MKRLIVFTDLDGTLLDYSDYSFETAARALKMLRDRDIPLVICSSKTKAEILFYRRRLLNDHPFVSENGGGIFIPRDYFPSMANDRGLLIDEEDEYHVIRLGARYGDIRDVIEKLRLEGLQVRGFGDMPADEVAELTGLPRDEAMRAKERDFDEPILFQGSDGQLQALFHSVRQHGFRITQGKFHHILGNSDKGKAVSVLIDLYRIKFGDIMSVAVGDSSNDTPMLNIVDLPIIVQRPDGSYDPGITAPNLIRAEGVGPSGWNESVLKLLEGLCGPTR